MDARGGGMMLYIQDVRREKIKHAQCGGHMRHWFTWPGAVGLHVDKCVRCGVVCPCTKPHDSYDLLLERHRAAR